MKKIAHHRYPLFAGMRPPAVRRHTPDILENDRWRAGQVGPCMPHTVRISLLCEGERCGEVRPLTAADLHDMLSFRFGLDETTLRFVCNQMEEAGICELRDETGTSGYLIEKILHA
ncbi:hypothetical protein [Pararhizobium sp. DWP1-1-3]|uniref:hypothetical protein n=1 Tax=Pararhizobium sp. DWP1-1-3 TaxID=2804652 RepID=UPI003CF88AA4